MIEPRIYRVAFAPAVLAVVLVMFSLQSSPRALEQGLPADVVFEGAAAQTQAQRIVDAAPDRRAGTAGDRRAARLVAEAFRQSGFTVEVDRFEHEEEELVNVVGRRAGESGRQIVVVADRDASGVPDAAGSASDTAALLQLARVFQGRPSEKTLVLASVDGSSLGQVGATRLMRSLPDPDQVDGIVTVSELGYGGNDPPAVIGWSTDTDRASQRLQRTAVASVREETGTVAPATGMLGQVGRLSFPLGIGAQGVLLGGGYDAVRIAGGGEREDTSGTTGDAVDRDRLGTLGRVMLRTVNALDGAVRDPGRPSAYVTVAGQVMPGWVLAVLGLTLIFPALVASVDAFARVRRRRSPVTPWLAWLAAGTFAFVLGIGLAHLLDLVGAVDPPAAPVAPDLVPLDAGALAVMAGVVIVVVGAWVGLRRAVVAADPDLATPSAPGAAVVLSLAMTIGLVVLWLVNPFSALIMVPALHLWMLATLVDPAPGKRTRLALVAGGLVLPALLVLYQLLVLGLNPLAGAWYLLLLVTGGHISVVSSLLGCLFVGVLGGVIAVARSTPPAAPRPPREVPKVRGPAGYAGPGSLGGTDSALRR